MLNKQLKELIDNNGFVNLNEFELDENKVINNQTQEFKTKNGDTYYFKPTPVNALDCYGEFVVQNLLRKYGVKCVEYYLAVYQGKKGVVSKDYKIPGETEVLAEEFLDIETPNTIEALEEHLFELEEKGEISAFEKKLYLNHAVEMFIADIINTNMNRTKNNWGHLISPKGKVRPIPVFSNAVCFAFYNKEDTLARVLNAGKKIQEDSFWVFDENMQLDFKDTSRPDPQPNMQPYLNQLIDLDEDYDDVLNKMMEVYFKLDIEAFIKNVELDHAKFAKKYNKEADFKLPDVVTKTIIKSFELRRNVLKVGFELVNFRGLTYGIKS